MKHAALSRFFAVCRSLLAALSVAFVAAFAPHTAAAQTTGVLTVLWGDPQPGSQAPSKMELWLNEDGGRMTKVTASDAIMKGAGGVMSLNNTRVSVFGARVPSALRSDVDEITASSIRPTRATPTRFDKIGGTANLLSPGSKPFITILCKFADFDAEPRPPSDFTTLISSNVYPNLDHYYRELSNNQIDLGGSNVVGWFVLPQPRSYYVSPSLNFTALTNDCTAAANASVDFSTYYGINMQFNADLNGSSQVPPSPTSGTGMVAATYDSVTKRLSWKGTYAGLSGPPTAAGASP